ncbi:Low-Density Lipoprotein Receptor-Related Protein 8, partial [Manis pentadactyla]
MTLGEQVQAYEKPFSSLKELAIIRVETHPRKQTHETTGNSLADQCAKQFAPIQVHRSEDGL